MPVEIGSYIMDHPPNLVTFHNMQGDGHMLLHRVSFYIYRYLNPEAGYTLSLSGTLIIWGIIARYDILGSG